MKTRVFENMNDLENNRRRGGHVKDNDISFVKDNNSIMIGDKNMRNPVLYPPILTTINLDSNNLQFTEDISLQIQKENNLEEVLKYCLIGFNIDDGSASLEVLSPFKLTEELFTHNFVPDYENCYYIVSAIQESLSQSYISSTTYFCGLEVSKQFPYLIRKIYESI